MPDLPVFLPVLFLLVFTSLTSGLQFHVAEELPAGTEVGQIPGRPASRTALTNHQDVFRLDPVSGKIFTLKPIDRDALKRDSFELFIANQDQSGFPTTVNVVVTDINDNAPAFPERTVGVVFLETDTVGQQVLLDAATDADSGENGRIGKYDIVSGNEDGFWRLVVRDNFLHLENLKVVDREVREAFLLNISATDNGVPARRGFLVLNITVGDINDQSPIFDPSEYVVALGENAPPGSMVLKVHATDNDALNSANSRIVYTLADASQFTVDAESGVIRTSQKKTQCPRSKCPNGGDCPRTCVLTVEGRDCGAAPLTGRAYVYITLMDENDHAPELTFRHYPSSAEHATVAEDAMNGTVVAVISVRDGDEGANGKVTLSVTGGNGEGLFRVEAASFASSGMPYSRSIPQMAYLKVNGQFNRARMAAYNLTITAVDAGYPSLNTSKCLTVIVNQINDHSPVFPRANYHATVNENSPVGSYVSGEVTATDADGPHGINGRILYSIVAGNARGWFSINGDTGMVTTGQALDREVEEVVRLNISARDAAPSPRIAYAMLTVIIADWNDHYPRFTHCPAGKVTLPGGTPVGTVVHNFAAADEDAGENGAVSYALFELRIPKAHTASDIGTPNDGIIADNGISPFLTASEAFALDERTGLLTTRHTLPVRETDRLRQTDMPRQTDRPRETDRQHNLLVIARDNGDPSQSSSCSVTVRIVSASAGPVFSALYWTIPTPDKLPAGHKIAQVKAEAAFDDEAGLIRYAIAHSSRNEISLDGRSGLLSTGDRELLLAPGELVKVQITATDSRGRAAERPTTVMLFPAHATENGTFGFTNAEGFHFTVRENSLSNFVGEMRLLDHESWPDVEYFITAGDALGQFTVDAATGHLRSAYPLDREAASSYHLHVTAWRSPFFARTSVQVRVEDENDNAPIIGNVRGDVYEIPRSWPVGLPLLSVRAEDADAGVNGQTTFSLVEEDGGADKQAPRLAVNRTTGSIYLVHPLSSSDTETVKSVVVVVQATDGGNLSSKGERIRFRFGPPKNCRIHFLNSMYRLSLPEDQAVNSRILNLTMQTCNQPIDFAFSHGNEAGHFGVFPDGQVYLNGSLDRAITAYYALHVTASSSDSFHSTTTSAVVMIHITGDTNHHAPAFSRSEYAFTVGENAAIGTFVGRPEAADFDDGLNGDLRYGLSECEGLFTVEPETGVVRTGVVFDREKSGLGVYTVTVTATDRADLQRNRNGQANLARNSTATIRITILDENDNAPQFTQSSYSQTVPEGTPAGQRVAQITATDSDIDPHNSHVTYRIQCPVSDDRDDGDCLEVFTLDAMTGSLRLNQPLNYESRSRYDLLVLAVDQIQTSPSQKTSTTILTIRVLDENDQVPKFLQTIYSVRVSESAAAGTMLVQTIALDADSVDSEISYAIVTGTAGNTEDKIFRVNRFGQIYLNYPLDYERAAVHNLTVRAFERDYPEHGGVATVLIEVEDANDNAPLFSEFIKTTIRVAENAPAGAVVATTLAHDEDSGVNGEVRYSILYAEPINNHFQINEETGQISTTVALDRELYSSYRLVLQATDQAVDTTLRQSSEKAITILIDDINDHAPVFTNTRTVIVPEYANSGYRLLTVAAVDRDAERNGHVTFDLTRTADMERFQLDRYDGHIYLRGELRLIAPLYTLTVVARDQSGDGRQSTVMNIDLVTASRVGAEKTVAFTQNVYEWTVTENERIGAEIGRVSAKLLTNSAGPLEYFLTGVTSANGDVVPCVFDVDQTSGAVMLKGQLDADSGAATFLLQVYAGVKGFSNYQVTASQIRIRVLSVNNRTPKFTSPYYRFKLPASAPVGLKLGQVAASDMDKSDSITFHLNGPVATDILTINQETGEIYLKRVPTNSGRVCFDVSADDSVHRSNVTCCVDVETPEHLVPAFTHDKYEFTVFVDDMEDGEQIGAVTVVGRGEKYEYFQSAEWFDNTFLVDRRSGAISVTESRFFTDSADEVKTVVLQIEASATSHPKSTNSTLVFITLLHSNSHQQVLPPLAARVSENASIGHCFADFFRDKHSVMKDDVVPRWTIYGDPHGHFSVSPLGLVCVRSPLDREAQSGVELTVSLHSGIYRAERPIFITIEDVNDEPPKFSSSIPTTLLIPRSTQITTEILKVHATDPDTGSGGEVQYRLISPENDFSIDTFSGVVRLNDADSLDSKPSFRLEIIAFDRGEPSLSATATCIVTVVHENLHAPRFTRSKYAVDVPENVSISHSVISLSATDYDQAGQHSDLRFWIIDGNSEELFQIDQATGQIFTAAALDYERQTSYELTVLVEDSSKNDTAVVSVYLQNVDDERPRFPTEEYHVQVMENWGGGPTTKTRLLQVHAVDADVPPFNEVRYRVKSGDGGSAFEVDEVTGWISLRQTLDREERDVYQVEIEARNAGISTTDTSGSAAREAASVLVVISVVDENDNAPVFTSKAVYHVKENSSNGTLVGDLVAVDRDLNATLRYVILTPAPFAVNSRTGKITTVGALDMKHAFEYHLVVQVDDGLHFVRTNVTVRLDDVDNHAPVFRPDSVTRYIPYSVSAGHFVVQAFAADADPSDPPCQYISNALDGFSLNQLTGVVTVSTPKLRLTSPVELSIQTTNQRGSTLQTSARMALQIHQAPAAHFPTFQSTTGVLTLSETTALDQIARVTAVPGTTVGPLTYRIAGGNSDGTFSIDSVTGQVRLEKPLDFEKFPRRDLWLEAAVDKYATPLLLQIEVKNVNDNAPVFTRDCFEVEVDEEETPRTFYTVAATDADGDALKYRLLNGTELFSLDQHSGGLRNTVKLDREKMGEMAVRVEASDGQFVTETQVRVVLRDKNDNPPKFSRQFTATVMENAPIGTLVVKVASVDADSPINAQAWYSLADESSRLFTIGRESGEVRVARNINRELYSEIPLEILVRDGSWQSKSLVMITVVGQNDHAPEFSQPEYVFFVLAEDVEGRSVTRKMGSLTSFNPVVIGQVSAVDGDENDIPNELSYSLKQHSTHFSIDRTSGRITAKRPLFTSANKPETFNLTVLVTEEAPMRRSTDTAVRITLLPKLPVTPAFAQSTFQLVMQMSELAPNNQVIRLTTRPSEISPKFAILSGNGSACFRLDTTRGTIQTLASVANCTVGTYQFQVAALYTDRSATTKTTVIIRLTEEPPQPVRFPADMYEVSVPETAAAGSVLFTAASAKTGDDSGATVGDDSGTTVGDDSGATVGDDSGATVGDDSGATVGDDSDLVQYSLVNHTDVFQVDSTTGAVRLKKQLDYESVREYAVQVTATASATQTATTTLIVSVLNENDNPPCFEETAYTAVLLESDKLGQTVITVRAADPDASSAPVYYTLEPESALFEIDSARGVITNVKELDYESARNHTLVVRAMDPADPSLYSEVAVLVVVEGRNEYPPVCAPGSPFVFSISAHAPAGTRIGDVFGTDADSGLDGVIEYFLVGNSPGFAVNQTSGQISMTSSQTVTVSEHHLHVLLKNSGTVAEVKSVVCDVVIHVMDGKNTPYFMQKEYFVRVREDVAVGTKVGVVSAMTVLQQKLRFTLTAGDDKGQFGIDSRTGEIRTVKRLDRETMPGYELEVMASVSESGKELSSTAMVHVTVEDVNDNAPFFDPALPSGHVKENLHYETAVLKLNATDRDLTPSFLTYRLASPAWKDHFKLNPSSGVLTAIRPLDREANPEIILKVNVSDSGSPPQTATLDVRVVVDDVNDNPSVERPLTIVVYLDELSNSNTKRRLGNVKPADRDEQGEYACQITDIQTNFAVEEGCELIGQDLRPGELYRLTVQGGDGKHDLVRYEVIVKAEAVTKLHHENSIAVRLAGVTAERFLDAHYVRLMQTLFGVFRNYGPVSVFGLTTLSATDCVVQISVGKSTTFLKGAKVADLMRMNMGEIEAQSGLKIGSVDFKPCETQSITALCSQTSVCENLIQTVPHQSTITTTASLIIVAPLFEYSHRCVCAEPFSGPQCELLCPPDYCLHGGTCAGNGKCVCRGGFHGSQCQFDLDECNLWGGSATPNCHNGGKCINTVGSFRCQCTAGFTGRHCEEERRCLGGNCPNSLVNGQSFGFGEVGSHLELRPWKSGSNHVSMVIATTKLDAVLLFTQGPGRSGTAHFVVLEIKKGFVYFAFGSNARDTTRIMVNRAVSDGRWYRIDVVKQDAMGSLTVVSCSEETCDDCPSGDESCSTVAIGIVKRQSFGNNSVYIGGIPAETPLDDPRFKHRTFIGCLKGLTVNGLTVRPSDTRATVGITEDTCGAIYTATPNLCQASSCSTNEICVNSATDGRYECVAAVPDTSDSQTVLIVALVCVTAVVFLLGGIVIWRYRKSTPARKKKANSYSGGRPPYLSPVSLFEQQYLTGSNYNERNGSNRTNGMNGNLYKDNSCIYHGGSQQDGPQHYYCVLREDHLRRPSRPQSHYASASIYESRVGAYANETAATQLARRNLMVASPADGSEEGKQSSASTQPVDVLSLDSADSAVLRYDPRSRHGLTFIPAPRGALDDVISDGCSDCDNCKSAVRSHYEMDNWNRIERYREQPTYAEVGDVLLEQHQIQQHSSSTLRHVLV